MAGLDAVTRGTCACHDVPQSRSASSWPDQGTRRRGHCGKGKRSVGFQGVVVVVVVVGECRGGVMVAVARGASGNPKEDPAHPVEIATRGVASVEGR